MFRLLWYIDLTSFDPYALKRDFLVWKPHLVDKTILLQTNIFRANFYEKSLDNFESFCLRIKRLSKILSITLTNHSCVKKFENQIVAI